MKKYLLHLYIFFLFFSSVLTSCSQHEIDTAMDDTPSVAPKFGPNFKFYNDPNLFVKYQARRTMGGADNAFTIVDVKKEDENLKITVNYKGGCKEHDFEIVWDGTVHMSNTENVNLLLKHFNNGDHCESLVRDSITLNLNRYFNNLIDAKKTVITVSNGSSIKEVKTKN